MQKLIYISVDSSERNLLVELLLCWVKDFSSMYIVEYTKAQFQINEICAH